MSSTTTEPETPRQPFLEARNVYKRFGGVQALRDASIQFFPGEVHCLAGENGCGKSTLMKVISGAHPPTSGSVVVNGTEYSRLRPRDAFNLGLEVIYQDFSLLPNLTAAENIALPGYLADAKFLVSKAKMKDIAEEALAKLGIDIALDIPVGELSVAERQLCAVARALAHQARFIAMDEPTTALTWREVDALFAAVHKLREDGVALAFISHKMQEVFSISDRVSVMRNGQVIETNPPSHYTHASLGAVMTGKENTEMERPEPVAEASTPVLEVKGLTHAPLFADIDLHINPGEIVGLSGLLGSGRTEIAEAIAGVLPAQSGTIAINGKQVAVKSMVEAMEAGIGYVPEDRMTEGLFMDQPISDNVVSAHLGRFSKLGMISPKKLLQVAKDNIANLRIKVGAPTDPVQSLSGGNAQRVLLAKWLVGKPKLLILNGPTVGVDVGSKFKILDLLRKESNAGLAVLIISDDVPELVSTCHRVLIVRSGRLVKEVSGAEVTEANIVEAIQA